MAPSTGPTEEDVNEFSNGRVRQTDSENRLHHLGAHGLASITVQAVNVVVS